MKILVLHGPNLNLLGIREPEIYGSLDYSSLCEKIQTHATNIGLEIFQHQSNQEGVLIDLIHSYRTQIKGIVINPGAYTHTSIAIRDALIAVDKPFIEVHLSNIYARESFRHNSYLSDIAVGQIVGLGVDGYLAAIGILHRTT